jgi:hypothetical protein
MRNWKESVQIRSDDFMKIIKPLVIKCDECDEIIEVDTDMECVSEDERQMGVEYEYEGIVEEICPKCGNELNIRIYAWEYPEGALNDSETEVVGAEIIEEPRFSPYD